MGSLKAFFAFLRSASVLIDLFVSMFEIKKKQERQERKQDEHDQIDNDINSALRDRGWLQSVATREDGAPRDYDVSGPSETLSDSAQGRIPRE